MCAGNASTHLQQLITQDRMFDGDELLWDSVCQSVPVFAWSIITDMLARQHTLESDLRIHVASRIYARDYVRAVNRKVG